MPLDKQVQVVSRFQRSVRIDSDIQDPSTLEGFLCTHSFGRALDTLAQSFLDLGHGAFTWTGPYGGGKSVLLLALACLLGPRGKARSIAEKVIDESTRKRVQASFKPGAMGWTVLPIVGARAPAHIVLWDALRTAKLVPRAAIKPPSPREVVRVLSKIANQPGHAGLFVAIDELGKVLEEAAINQGDLNFLQDLAETASRSNNRLCIVGVLHQAFGDYAARLHKEARDEWTKVQGRFIDIPLSPTGGEQLELLARAISARAIPSDHGALAKAVSTYIKRFRPDAPVDAESVLKRCWPLHPVTACLLGPISRRRFGQNQRSLFAFLNSREPGGFQEFLQTARTDSLYLPSQLFDYLQINFEPAILASPDGHRWSLALDALERAEKKGASTEALQALKSIALLDLFRERSGLFATKEVLSTVFLNTQAKRLSSQLDQLRQWSVLAYREHINSYAIFAGSDFDLQSALEDAKRVVREPDLKALRQLANLRPIVAKRHYHQTGAFRWLDVDVARKGELRERVNSFALNGAFGQVFLLVPDNNDSDKALNEFAQKTSQDAKLPCVIGVCPTVSRVMELTVELLELEHIRTNHPQLRDDQVARREVDARTATSAQQLEAEVRNAFINARFYRNGERVEISGLRDLTRLASDLADSLFAKTPVIINELLNRASPSSNANAALKALLRAMVQNSSIAYLGIAGFPPERGLYDSILAATGLHTVDNEIHFSEPQRSSIKLSALWKATDDFLMKAAKHPMSAADVFRLFASPPFGVRSGIRPILFLAYLQTRSNRYTFYLDGIMESQLNDFTIDRLLIDPTKFSLRTFDPTERQRELINGAKQSLRTIGADRGFDLGDTTDLARALVSVVQNQPTYVMRTGTLSKPASLLRGTLRAAIDPQTLLHETLPTTLEAIAGHDSPKVSELLSILDAALKEIAFSYQALLHRIDSVIRAELDILPGELGAADLRQRAEQIRDLTGDLRVEAFIGRLCDYGVEAIEGIASLALSKAPRDWSDNDVNAAVLELSKLAERFKKAEAFARVKGRPNGRHAISFVIGLDRSPRVISSHFEVLERDRKRVLEVARTISTLGKECKPEVLLAALAQVGSDLIGAESGPQQKTGS